MGYHLRMSEPFDPSTSPAPALPLHRFQSEDFEFLGKINDSREIPLNWEESMQALAKHRGLQREQLPAEPPSRLN